MECPKCGKKTLIDWMKCPACGYKFFEATHNKPSLPASEIDLEREEDANAKLVDDIQDEPGPAIDSSLSILEGIGWVWFILFTFVALGHYIYGVNLSKTTTYVHFPYHVWKMARAIWWLILALPGIMMVGFCIIGKRIDMWGARNN